MYRPGSMTIGRVGATATRLQDGTVLVLGTEGSADLFDPKTGMFTAVGGLFPAYPPVTQQRTASLRNDGVDGSGLRHAYVTAPITHAACSD